MSTPPDDAQLRRSRRITIAGALLLVVAGVVAGLLMSDDGEIVAGFLIGVAAIIAVGRVFYEIGIGEDRDRARGRS